MKTPLIAISALLLGGCESSSTQSSITAEQATALSVQLANDRTESLYHRRPFANKQPAQFENGRWIWRGLQGSGTLDFHATVELAADSSTNNVDVRITDDALHPQMVVPNEGPGNKPIPPYFKK